jgi:hypothetical protein
MRRIICWGFITSGNFSIWTLLYEPIGLTSTQAAVAMLATQAILAGILGLIDLDRENN